MIKWRLAKSLEVLRVQINERWRNRSKESDGTIGDANHASRSSDHNPHIVDPGGPNVVSAMDITHDPGSGLNSYVLAEVFRANRDPRIKYVISNRKIFSSTTAPWQWRTYSGQNPHDHHVHISVKEQKHFFDDLTPWALDARLVEDVRKDLEAATKATPIPSKPTLRRGDGGETVKELQRLLGITADGVFGEKTTAAVKLVQIKHKLVSDGIVGPQTWKALVNKGSA